MSSNSGKGFTIAIKLNLSLDQNLFPTIQPFVFPATPSQHSILLHSICNGDQIELINVRLLITPLMYSVYTMVPFSRIYLRCITYMPSLCLIKLNCVKCITWPSTQCLISFVSLCIFPDSWYSRLNSSLFSSLAIPKICSIHSFYPAFSHSVFFF